MKIHIKTSNITLTQAISDYVDRRLEKVSKIVGDDETVQCDVELGRTTTHHHKGEIFRAEIHLVGFGKNLYVSSETTDLYTSIDEVQSQILSELSSHKQKNISLLRRGGSKVKAMAKGLWPWRRESI